MEQKFLGLKPVTVNYPFSDSELARLSKLMANKLEAKSQLVEEKKSVAKEFASRIEMLDTAINKLKSQVNSGYMEQEVMAECYVDFERKLRVYKDKTTGEEIKVTAMEQSDFQLKAFPEQEITGQVTGEAVAAEIQSDTPEGEKALENEEEVPGQSEQETTEEKKDENQSSVDENEQAIAPISTGTAIPTEGDIFEPLPDPFPQETIQKPKNKKKDEKSNV